MRARAKLAIIAGALSGACLVGVDSPWTVLVVMLLTTGVVAHLASGRGRYLYLRDRMWSQHHAYLDGNDVWGVYGQQAEKPETDPIIAEIRKEADLMDEHLQRQLIVNKALRDHSGIGGLKL